jgi:hypothetical protein
MKNSSKKIAANEINRFIYCPYQWYYARYYGSKELNRSYKALDLQPSEHESHFIKGQRLHHSYYKHYRLKRALQVILLIVLAALLVVWLIKWK